MTGILIATHHNLAEAFRETVEMIAGKHDFVESVGLRAGQDPEAFGQLIADKVEQFHQRGHEEVVVMLDLFGVTASQLIAMAVDNGRGGIFDAGARIQSLTEEE